MDTHRVLFTGGTGFIGQNVLPILREKNEILAPRREELNLFHEREIRKFIVNNHIDTVLHCANPNPGKNTLDSADRMLRDSLHQFMSIYECRDILNKMIYLGSGAIYDKTLDIVSVSEMDAYRSVPKDDYGFAKYIMNDMTRDNVYNLCVFGCYGPGDAESKFITHCIRCCLRNEPITIRQNCMFDYMHVYDLGKIMSWMIESNPMYNMYNACSGTRFSLLEIAQIVRKKMKSDLDIVVLKDGWNKEYTGSNERLLREYNKEFISLDQGIDIQIEWERSLKGVRKNEQTCL